MNATAPIRAPLSYSDAVVRNFALAAVLWGVVGMLVGVVIAAQLTWPELNLGISWLSYGRDQDETRYSTLRQIDSTNAKRLGLAWSYVMGAGGGNQEGTPLMWNNTLYGITTWSVVFAIDARTGKELWRWDPEVNPSTRSVICCGNVNRGVALYNGMIIAPSIDGRLWALNALTGKPVWETRGTSRSEYRPAGFGCCCRPCHPAPGRSRRAAGR